MVSITFNEKTLLLMSLFENVAKVPAKDCVETKDKVVFIVNKGLLGRAIGKDGRNIKLMKKRLNKDVHLVEHSDDPQEFVKNVFCYYDVKKVELEKRGNITHATVTVDPKNKAKAIGREGRNLKIARDIIARHHDVQSVCVA